MSTLLQKIMIALGRRGVQTPIDRTLGDAYRALQQCHALYPSIFPHAAEILLAEVEGGGTSIEDVPKRIAHLSQMLDRLHREEELEAWATEDMVVTA
jgi:hypothetical protein